MVAKNVKNKVKKLVKEKDILRLKINFEGISLEVVSNDPNKTLSQLIKLINSKKDLIESIVSNQESLGDYTYSDDDEFGFDVNSSRFTKELLSNKEYIETLKNLSLKHKNLIYRNERFEAKQELDFTNKRLSMVIDKQDVKGLIKKLFYGINFSKLKHVFIHIISDTFTKDHEFLLVEEIRKTMVNAETTIKFTPKKLNGVVVVETLFFGDFPQNNEEN